MKCNNSFGLFVMSLLIMTPAHSFVRGRSFFSMRSQSTHAERELCGWEEEVNLYTEEEVCYGSFSTMIIYSRSTNAQELAGYLFGTDTIEFSGSHVTIRGQDDVLADYFGLPIDYQSTVCTRPRIQNTILDFNLYVGFDAWCQGLYMRFHAPFVNTIWDLRLREFVEDPGDQPYPAGYMASKEIPRAHMAHDVLSWLRGERGVGDIQPLEFGKVNCACSKTGLSDVQVVLGWNMIDEPDYHFGLNLRTAIPTGNHSTSVVFFEPIVGNGGHWELGFGLTGHTFLWDDPCGKHAFSVYGDLNLTHLFASRERRSFDLKSGGAGSRYILIEEIGVPVVKGLKLNDELNTTPTPPQFAEQQYHGKVMPAINQTTLFAEVSIALQVDAVIKLAYCYNSFSADIGYDLWARTAERINCRQAFPENCYAVKGDAQLYGFAQDNPQGFIALNATQHEATMHAGQVNKDGETNTDFANKNADNAAIAVFEFQTGTEIDLNQSFPPIQPVAGSKQAMLLFDADIDTRSAASPAAITNSFFIHGNYAWECIDMITPYVGAGAEVSLDASGSTRNNAVSEWALWIKGGLSY